MPLLFVKYHGCGNDFILVDDRFQVFPKAEKGLIAHLCHRRTGIGADGLILLQEARQGGDFQMQFFNADGSEASMCGNGLRCLAHYAHQLGVEKKGEGYQIETGSGTVFAKVKEESVEVVLGPYQWLKKKEQLEGFEVDLLHVGVPHAVIFLQKDVQEIEQLDLCSVARPLRFHAGLHPEGANVNFVQIVRDGVFKVRTYERGVEGETLACGTGSAAAAVVAGETYGWEGVIEVIAASQERLKMEVKGKQILMTGPVKPVFEGVIT